PTSSLLPSSPSTFKNSAGISSTPTALFLFISRIASTISLVNNSGPLLSSWTLISLSTVISSASGFPSLSYNISIYSFHLSLILSGSVSNLPSLSFIVVLLPAFPLLRVNFLTFTYTTSDLPLLSNSSISSHSLSHHSALAFSVSLLSSLFSCLYLTCPSSVRLLFHFLLFPIYCNISSVTHGFSPLLKAHVFPRIC